MYIYCYDMQECVTAGYSVKVTVLCVLYAIMMTVRLRALACARASLCLM